jgi:integrase
MRFLAVTFVRTSELIGAKWQEIDFEGVRGIFPPTA